MTGVQTCALPISDEKDAQQSCVDAQHQQQEIGPPAKAKGEAKAKADSSQLDFKFVLRRSHFKTCADNVLSSVCVHRKTLLLLQ